MDSDGGNKNKKVMDVKDINTRCIPETILLCVERICYIIDAWTNFWFRTFGIWHVPIFRWFAIIFVVLVRLVGKVAYFARYHLRMFIDNHLVENERKIALYLAPISSKIAKKLRGGNVRKKSKKGEIKTSRRNRHNQSK